MRETCVPFRLEACDGGAAEVVDARRLHLYRMILAAGDAWFGPAAKPAGGLIREGGPRIETRALAYYALTWLRLGQDPARAEAILHAVMDLQRPDDPVWPGNFLWYQGQESVQDPNAVSFIGDTLATALLQFAERLKPATRDRLRGCLEKAFEAAFWRDCGLNYTNIVLMDVLAMTMIGHALGRADCHEAAHDLWDGWVRFTAEHNVSEFNCIGYTLHQVAPLMRLGEVLQDPARRRQARAAMEYLLYDFLANRHPVTGVVGGSSQRMYPNDYLAGRSGDTTLTYYFAGEPAGGPLKAEWRLAESRYAAPGWLASLLQRRTLPETRINWSSYGPGEDALRHHYLAPTFSVGSASMALSHQTIPLLATLGSKAGRPTCCYFDVPSVGHTFSRQEGGEVLLACLTIPQLNANVMTCYALRYPHEDPRIGVRRFFLGAEADVEEAWFEGRPIGGDDVLESSAEAVRVALRRNGVWVGLVACGNEPLHRARFQFAVWSRQALYGGGHYGYPPKGDHPREVALRQILYTTDKPPESVQALSWLYFAVFPLERFADLATFDEFLRSQQPCYSGRATRETVRMPDRTGWEVGILRLQCQRVIATARRQSEGPRLQDARLTVAGANEMRDLIEGRVTLGEKLAH